MADRISYDATPAFVGAGADLTDLTREKNIALAASLNAYASSHGIARISVITGTDGKATFTALPKGLYLVAQLDAEESEYIVAPYLVSVPHQNDRTKDWEYDVISYPKTEPMRRDGETISVSVHKIWAKTDSTPASIKVQLYRGGQPHGDVVILSADNFWSHTWDGLDANEVWTVDEVDVPTGYTKVISGNVTTGFIITNTRNEGKPKDPLPSPPPGTGKDDGSGAPKTGDTLNAQMLIALITTGFLGFFMVIYAVRSKCLAEVRRKQ
jgi:hypothetical protein